MAQRTMTYYEEEGIEGGETVDKMALAFLLGVITGVFLSWLLL